MNPKFEESAGEQDFILSSGNRLDSIKDLYYALDTMESDEFNSHVNHDKNDFSDWVRGVFHEEDLADHILLSLDKEDMRNQIEDWNNPSTEDDLDSKNIDVDEIIDEEIKDEIEPQKLKPIDDEDGDSRDSQEEIVIKKINEPDHTLEDINDSLKNMKSELHTKMHPHILAGIMDFIFGFIIGALAMILLFRLI